MKMKTRIGIDIRTLARGNKSGIEEYTCELLGHMLELDRSIEFKLFYNGWKKSALEFDWLHLPNVTLSEFRIPNRLLDFSAGTLNRPHLDQLLRGVDKFFSPHIFLTPTSARCEKIVTFHDLSYDIHPEFYSSQKNFWHFSMAPQRQARHADKLIAMSQSTKEDLVERYGLQAEKIRVISPGLSPDMGRAYTPKEIAHIREKYQLPEDYILCLCTLEPRKNLLSLIRAFDCSKRAGVLKDSTCHLVIAGNKGWLYEEIFRTVRHLSAKNDILFTGPVDEADKPAIYELARVFVYPSFYEGFGFPPLEAMSRGVPVITSDITSLPEVVQDAALLINPSNQDELRLALEKVLTDRELRERLAQSGRRRAAAFDWQRCAEETLGYIIA